LNGDVYYTTEAIYHSDTNENDYIYFMDVVGNDPVYMRCKTTVSDGVTTETLSCNGKELTYKKYGSTNANYDAIRMLHFDLRTADVFHSYAKKYYTSSINVIDLNNSEITVNASRSLYAYNGTSWLRLDYVTETKTERLYVNGIWTAEDVYELMTFEGDDEANITTGTASNFLSIDIASINDGYVNAAYLILPDKPSVLTEAEKEGKTESEIDALRIAKSIQKTRAILSIANFNNGIAYTDNNADQALFNEYYNNKDIEITKDKRLRDCKLFLRADLMGGLSETKEN
jgi:hypothetical protein